MDMQSEEWVGLQKLLPFIDPPFQLPGLHPRCLQIQAYFENADFPTSSLYLHPQIA